jgi:hypothetical protein
MTKRDKYKNEGLQEILEAAQQSEPTAVAPPPLPENPTIADALASLPLEVQADVKAALNPEEIEDSANVLRLALLEERITHANIARQFRRLVYELKLRDLKNEAKLVDSQLEMQGTQFRQDLAGLQREIEIKYGIKLFEYGYDEVTGKLTKLPPGAVTPPKSETLQ